MTRGSLEVADIIRSHEADLIASRRGRITAAERRVLLDISRCRTAALGGHVDRCDHFLFCMEGNTFLTWEAVIRDEQGLPLSERHEDALDGLLSVEDDPNDRTLYIDESSEASQREGLARLKAERDEREALAAISDLRKAAEGSGNLVPYLLRCAHAYCTESEIVGTLKGVFGEYHEPAYSF